MRRSKQEITDTAEIESILDNALVIRLGLIDNGLPYIVPLCFGYKNNRLYFHSAHAGRKIAAIKENNSVCFEAEIGVEIVPADGACDWSVKYRSVIGFGKALPVDDPREKERALNAIMEHYSGKSDHDFPDVHVKAAAVYMIEIDFMTGKRSKKR